MSTPGLVMWEVVYRIQTSPSISPAYQPPYWDLVNLDPSLDEMRKVVCLDMMRPDTPADWETRLAQSGCRYFQIVIKYFCYAKKIFLSTSYSVQGASPQPGAGDVRVLVQRARGQAHRAQNQEESPEVQRGRGPQAGARLVCHVSRVTCYSDTSPHLMTLKRELGQCT